MGLEIVVGALYGDEGKGRVAHLLAQHSKVCARFNGGGNASHTVFVDDEKYTLRQIPCGILWPHTTAVTGDGMLVNPVDLVTELDELAARGVRVGARRLRISSRAHVVLPWHALLDDVLEERRGPRALGTTRQGIGPAASDKVMRTGLRVADLFDDRALRERLALLADEMRARLGTSARTIDVAGMRRTLVSARDRLRPYVLGGDARRTLLRAIDRGERVLVEGAQGVLLDVDHGAWPHVTATHPTPGGALASLGLPASSIDRVIGCTRAYCTRQAKGFFPTEVALDDERAFRQATRDHALRIGWLDCVMLRYAHSICGFDELIVTGLDRLAGLRTVKLCVSYGALGADVDKVPSSTDRVTPRYATLKGWDAPFQPVSRYNDLPLAARRFVDRIEEEVGVRVARVSCGREGPLLVRRRSRHA